MGTEYVIYIYRANQCTQFWTYFTRKYCTYLPETDVEDLVGGVVEARQTRLLAVPQLPVLVSLQQWRGSRGEHTWRVSVKQSDKDCVECNAHEECALEASVVGDVLGLRLHASDLRARALHSCSNHLVRALKYLYVYSCVCVRERERGKYER